MYLGQVALATPVLGLLTFGSLLEEGVESSQETLNELASLLVSVS